MKTQVEIIPREQSVRVKITLANGNPFYIHLDDRQDTFFITSMDGDIIMKAVGPNQISIKADLTI